MLAGSKALVVVAYLFLHFEEFKLETDEGKATVFAEAAFLWVKSGSSEGSERSQSSENFRGLFMCPLVP